jgi:formylglycine-generating enzyme required for sulfatase activity
MSASSAKAGLLLTLLPLLALICLAPPAHPQTPAVQVASQRVAFVIGNEAYPEAPAEAAVDGARELAGVLRQGGFKVFYLENARRDEILQALAAFARSLDRGGSGLVFYAGHAVQHQGRNYLVAIDAKIAGPDDLRREAVDLDLLLDPLIVARTPGSVVVLDASRANPWQRRLGGGNVRGLAEPEEMKAISFICSAAPGRVVSDSPKAARAFAEKLVEALRTPGLGLAEAVNKTRTAVARLNGRSQRVWQSSPLPADLVVLPEAKAAAARPADKMELGFWETIKESDNPADYSAYLSAYPEGQFALIAKAKLAGLQPKSPSLPRLAAGEQTAAAAPDRAPPQASAPAPSSPPTLTPPPAPASSAPIRDCQVCPELVLIPVGTMTMGAADGFAFETPLREVTIAKPFYIGRREVTFDEWDACLAEGGCQYRPGDRGQGRGLRPAVDLDWNDAQAFVIWLTRKTGKNYRLPTEAEWEYAARAGTKSAFYWGPAIEKDRANCAGCNSQPLNQAVPTGTFPANAFGLLDMAGNAAEWVEDCWEDSYRNAPRDGSAVKKPDCRERVLRGGSFNNDQRFVRTAARFKYDFDVRYYTNGFRVVREK